MNPSPQPCLDRYAGEGRHPYNLVHGRTDRKYRMDPSLRWGDGLGEPS
jgi:hypothetical protein